MKIKALKSIVYGAGKEAQADDIIDIQDATAASLIASGFAVEAPAAVEPEPQPEAPAGKPGKPGKPASKAEAAEEL